jgi:hypothetical protein
MITQQVLLSRARNVISDNSDDPTTQTFSDSELSDWLTEVIIEYSGYKPFMQRTVLPTVANQDTYTLPSDATWIINLRMGANQDLTYLNSAFTYSFYDMWVSIAEMTLNDRSLWELRQDAFAFFAERGQPVWAPYNADQVIVFPIPLESDLNITIDYGSIHVSDSGGNYPTIPAQDAPAIRKLLEAKLLDIIATSMTMDGDTTQAQTKSQYNPDLLTKKAQRLKSEAAAALDVGVAMRS